MDRILLDEELKRLNKAVEDAIKVRTAWMDKHMHEYATHAIGETVFTENGERLGVIKEYYRFNVGPYYDTSMEISYHFTNGDNTSRRSINTRHLYTQKELANLYRLRAKNLSDG